MAWFVCVLFVFFCLRCFWWFDLLQSSRFLCAVIFVAWGLGFVLVVVFVWLVMVFIM